MSIFLLIILFCGSLMIYPRVPVDLKLYCLTLFFDV